MILDKIVETKKKEVAQNKQNVSISHLDRAIAKRSTYVDFEKALSQKPAISLIAEIKKASPSKGIIRDDFNPIEIAKTYETAGASAISILTDKEYFKGDIEYLADVRQISSLPLLRKDFIIDEYQILEAAAFGADAILLIAAILTIEEMKHFILKAKSFNMACLLEVHNEEELLKALEVDAPIIGINNRNLQTFNVDIKTTKQLMDRIPKNKIIVSESGIHTKADMAYLKSLNIDACLVGESLMKEADIAKKIQELLGT